MPTTPRKPPILGIDIGTSTCLACVIDRGREVFIRPGPGSAETVMPSVFLHVGSTGETFVGEEANREVDADERLEADLVAEVKRLMRFEKNDRKHPTSGGRKFAPSRITSHYLRHLREAAEQQLGYPSGSLSVAVVTVPVDFGSVECEATREACRLAGIDDVYLLDEPVAAAYVLDQRTAPGVQRVLVGDLGGGTFDVVVLEVGQGAGVLGMKELMRDGDSDLGGVDWDRAIADWVARQTTPRGDYAAVQRLIKGPGEGHRNLFRKCEEAKKEFFALGPETGFPAFKSIVYQAEALGLPKEARMEGKVFEAATRDLVKRCIGVCDRAFADLTEIDRRPFGWPRIDRVFLAGGGSRMWTVRKALEDASGRPTEVVERPQHAIARGAALHGQAIRDGVVRRGDGRIGRPRYNRTLGLRVFEDDNQTIRDTKVLVKRNRPLPFSSKWKLTFPSVRSTGGKLDLEFVFVEQRPSPSHAPAAADQQGEWEDFGTYVVAVVPAARNGQGRPPSTNGQDDVLMLDVSCEPEGSVNVRGAFRGVPIELVVDGKVRKVPIEREFRGPSS